MQQVIAIDGPSGVGKSSVSKLLAHLLGWTYLDTGAMYRAVTHAWLRRGGEQDLLRDESWLAGLDLDVKDGAVVLDGADVSGPIREADVTNNVSLVAAEPSVRRHLTRMQREIGNRRPCVLDGRDIGTVVFPDAFFKVFLTADPAVRARRRWLELGGEAAPRSLAEVEADMAARDRKDSSREVAPLKRADDALPLATDGLTLEQVADTLYREAQARLKDA